MSLSIFFRILALASFSTVPLTSYLNSYTVEKFVASKPETKPSTSVAKKENKTAKKVNTGVKNSTTFFTGLMGVSVAALGVVEVLKRRNK